MSFNTAEISRYDGRPMECYRFAHGVEVWRYTSGDEAVTLTDGVYTPEAVDGDSIDQSREWDSGGQKITLDYLNPVAQLWIDNLPREPVTVTVYSVHRGEADVPVKFVGEVSGARSTDQSVVLTCVPTQYRLRRRIPTLRYASKCPLALYGVRCGVPRESFRLRVVLSAVGPATLTSAALAAQPDGWWLNGYIRTLEGETRFIVAHAGSLLTLEYPLSVTIGESVDVFAGCDRTLTTCDTKFSNLPNHLGFHALPTRDLFGVSVE